MALIANLRHYLGDDLSLVKIPVPAATLREFLGCIAEAVTSRDPDDINYVTQLKCRKGSGGCDGDIIAFFDQGNPSIIKWSCMFCKDEGQLTGWERTIWDKSSGQQASTQPYNLIGKARKCKECIERRLANKIFKLFEK